MSNDMMMTIYRVNNASSPYPESMLLDDENEPSSSQQLIARFDLGVVTGILRFIKPTATKGFLYRDQDFDLGAIDMSGSARETRHFRWRGRDSSENIIQLGSDQKIGSIDFSKDSTILSGRVAIDAVGEAAFEGIRVAKVESTERKAKGLKYEWERLSDEQYEQERTGRWG